MIRNAAGSLLALIGAAAAVRSPFRPWYDGRHGRDFRIGQLFDDKGVTGDGAHLLNGLFLPMFVAVVVTLLGLLNQSRPLIFLAGVLVLGFTILWMVRQTQAQGSLTAGGDGLDVGVGLGFAAGTLLMTGASLMRGRRRRGMVAHRRHCRRPAPVEPYRYEPYGYAPYRYEAEPHAYAPYAYEPYAHEPYTYEPYTYEPPQGDAGGATVRPFPEPPREAPFQSPYPAPYPAPYEDRRNAA